MTARLPNVAGAGTALTLYSVSTFPYTWELEPQRTNL